MMNNLRNSRLRARRSRKANIPARSRVSLADFSSRRRPPTNPFAAWKIRFLDRFRAAPLFERIAQLSCLTRGALSLGTARIVGKSDDRARTSGRPEKAGNPGPGPTDRAVGEGLKGIP